MKKEKKNRNRRAEREIRTRVTRKSKCAAASPREAANARIIEAGALLLSYAAERHVTGLRDRHANSGSSSRLEHVT